MRKKSRGEKVKQKSPSNGTGGSRAVQNLDELWSRAGARTVAGVTYQVAVSVHLLVLGRAQALPISVVTPEGFEDVDCVLVDGSRLLVQAKDRAAGQGELSVSEVLSIVRRNQEMLGREQQSRLVIATDANLARGLRETGWDQPLGADLAADLKAKDGVVELLDRSHIVRLAWDIGQRSVTELARLFSLPLAVAGLVHTVLLRDLAIVASDQRFHSHRDARSRRVSDVDTFVQDVLRTVDVDKLDEAVRLGVGEYLGFVTAEELKPEQFLSGVKVRPGHIVAGLDLPRPEALFQISEGLRESRYVLIAGPSGAGKSALLWRAAYDLAGFVRPLRILRLGVEDVEILRRWIQLQSPSSESPVLVCADDLGRPHMSGWPLAVSRLLDIPGVMLLGAARQEDFLPELVQGSASIVMPKLSQELAQAIALTLAARQIETRLDPSEAYAESRQLLMEFLALLISGRRLEQLVSEQVDERIASDRRTEIEALRYICAANVVGLGLPAAAVKSLTGSPPDLIKALARLKDEHLITTDRNNAWTGLHELRSEVINSRIHEFPPPTEAETFGMLLSHLASAERRHLIVKLGLRADAELDPVADSIVLLITNEGLTVPEAAELLEALAEADSGRYARECLSFVKEPSAFDPYWHIYFAYVIRYGIMTPPAPMPAQERLAQELPEKPLSLRELVLGQLPPSTLESLLRQASRISDLTRLLESLEGVCAITKEQVQELASRFPSVPIVDRGKLYASLASLAGLSCSDWPIVFGPLESRLRAIVAEHPNGLSYRITSEGEIVATVDLLLPSHSEDAHQQAVDCVRSVLDLCGEVDYAEIITLAPDGERYVAINHEPAYKRIPRGNLPRTAETRVHSSFLDALKRLLSSRYWTDRLRAQLEISSELVGILAEVPTRLLNPHDNAGRRRDWFDRIMGLERRINVLAPPPTPGIDRNTPDPAKEFLVILTMAVKQLGQLEEPKTHRFYGIAAQILRSLEKLEEARSISQPKLSGLGDPLPPELGISAKSCADLLLALADGKLVGRPFSRASGQAWEDLAPQVVQEVREKILVEEGEVLSRIFAGLESNVEIIRIQYSDLKSLQLVKDRWLVLVSPENLQEAARLVGLPEDLRTRLLHRVYIVATLEGTYIPLGALLLGMDSMLPTDLDQVRELLKEHIGELASAPFASAVKEIIDLLIEASRGAALVRLRSIDLGRPPWIENSMEALRLAEDKAAQIDDSELQDRCFELAAMVKEEFSGSSESLVGEYLAALLRGEEVQQTDRTRLMSELLVLAMLKAAPES